MKKFIVLLMCFCLAFSVISCQKPEQKDIEWKSAYLNFIESRKDICTSYALVYVDNDDIPELYLCGFCEAEGDSICSYKNGSVVEQKLNRIGGGRYIERGGKIVNQNGHTGVFCTDVYQLTENGFTQSLEAVCERQVKYIDDDNYELYYKHFISGNPVSEYEHDIAVYTSFDFTQALRLDENAVSYEQIKQQITDH